MFGGGATPRKVDPVQPIRASAIRGQLRFWWRACNAGRFESLEALRREEARLWGSARKESEPASGPGVISIAVQTTSNGTEMTDQDGPKYVLWPFAEQHPQNAPAIPAATGRVNVQFTLRLTMSNPSGKLGGSNTSNAWPTEREAAIAARQALWAWITFGGVGSRTRRGCGTLFCQDCVSDMGIRLEALRPDPTHPDRWMKQQYAKRVIQAFPPRPEFSGLAGARLLISRGGATPTSAWSNAIDPLFDFVQGEGIARNNGKWKPHPRFPERIVKTPGQSFWPEVSAVRGILGWPQPVGTPLPPDDHSNLYTRNSTSSKDMNQFPRAELGLPRVIRVATEAWQPSGTIEGAVKEHTRMASAVILKAFVLSDGRAISLALCLSAPHVWDTKNSPGIQLRKNRHTALPLQPDELNSKTSGSTWPGASLRNPQDPITKLPPFVATPIDGQLPVSARDAFMNYVKSRGWTVVR